jgi:hypothetical protein
MRVSRSISLLIGFASGREVHGGVMVCGPIERMDKATVFRHERRTASWEPATLRDLLCSNEESRIMSMMSIDLLSVWMGSADTGLLRLVPAAR